MRRRRLGLVLLTALAALVVAALASMRPGDERFYPVRPGQRPIAIYLIDNGFHTDVALPRSELAARGGALALAAGRLKAGEWVAVGWGDAAFYAGKGVSVARVLDGLRALFAPNNRAVLYLYSFDGSPDVVFVSAEPVRLSAAGFDRMLGRIDRSFAPGPRLASPGVGQAAFFESAERFSILKLCNHWTGEVLNAAGLPIIGALHLTPAGLKLDLRLRAGLGEDG